ncbi:hypothetical protein [Secundilactobacillus folii]|uniref:Surface layer protein A domain-containing protein n=1 Tax=Secundilactobacillus folii TaxID=2678357 RepID=A0A7X3C272_9LACO|nr:hypothetical protein [Secundilactobacillus folii]MTV82530.1 hypothetical protein [Secundilactobacillus folii]
MKIRTAIAATLIGLSLGAIGAGNTAQAKSWHYKTTSSNAFSTKKFNRAYMYRGRHDDFANLYSSARTASTENVAGFVYNFSDIYRNKTYYARKNTTYKGVYDFKYKGHVYYVNLKDVKFYRFNTWRSGKKLISFAKPNNASYVMLKKGSHFNKHLPWYWMYAGSKSNLANIYKLSTKGNWYKAGSKY